MVQPSTQLELRPLSRMESDDSVLNLVLDPPGPIVIGRSSEAQWAIPAPSVSRKHASLESLDNNWFLKDLGSRHGSTINGKRLEPNELMLIHPGDLIGFGGWMCRCSSLDSRHGMTTPFTNTQPEDESISAIDSSLFRGVAQQRLDAILKLTRALDDAKNEVQVAEAVVHSVTMATGCKRVVVTRLASDSEFELLASSSKDEPTLSRSLIDAAARDGLVELKSTGGIRNQAHSIMSLDIQTAICAPILSGDSPAAYLVLDTRSTEKSLPHDAAVFCQSIADVAGLSFERLYNAELVARHAQLQQDLGAARRAQEFLQPPLTGTLGNTSYAFESYAGRVVAGDLFDIFELDSSRTAFFLGDVSGKGVGAAVLMAAAQSQLRTHLLAGDDLCAALSAVNSDLYKRTDSSKFVTLIAGVIDAKEERLEISDAGHGLCVVIPNGSQPLQLEAPHGFPLGVVGEAEYKVQSTEFLQGSVVVFFSDGVVEQPNPEGNHFGFDAALSSTAQHITPTEITSALVNDVRSHAEGDYSDDLTVASMRLDPT
ncbi:MAG: SpoIIE family protein phosphatase [Phycisphaerales bacterium]